MKSFLSLLIVTLVMAITGCSGGGGNGGDSGVAPSISSLSYYPTYAYVNDGGGQIEVNGTVSFVDPDGDVSTVTLRVRDSTGQAVVNEVIPVIGAGGITSGTLNAQILISTVVADNYTVQVFVTDASGHQSNQLEGGFRITDFPWVTKTPMQTPRLKFSAATVNGLIYVMGGGDALSGVTPKPPMTTVEIYNPANDTWSTGAAMPLAVSEAMSAVVNGKIYVIGGKPDLNPASNAVQEYDPVANSWSLKTTMPDSRYAAAAMAYNNLIYIAGGTGTGTELDSLLIYDPTADSWSAGSQMSQARHGQSGAEVNAQLLVYGGYNLSGYLGTLESYNPLQDTWTTKTSGMPRTEVGVAVDSGLFYAFGGNNALSRTLDSSAMYDSVTDTWTSKTAMPVAIGFARAVTVNGKIYVFDSTATLEYTPANDGM